MCDPISIAGGLLSIAGSAVAAQQNSAYVDAQNEANRQAYEVSRQARLAELDRQKAFEDDAAAYWDKTADALGVEQHEKAQEDASQEFMQNFDEQAALLDEGFLLSGQDNASEEIKTEIAKRANTAAADARKRVQALADLSAYGNADLTRSQTLGNNADFLSTLNNKRRGSLGVSQQEQSIGPASVTPGSSIMGDVLSGGGGIVSSFGGGKKYPMVTPQIASAPGGLY